MLPSKFKTSVAQIVSDMSSRQPHERMVANAKSMEALLHITFGRGIKWLSVAINDSDYANSVQLGEKICVAALKCFTVSL